MKTSCIILLYLVPFKEDHPLSERMCFSLYQDKKQWWKFIMLEIPFYTINK